ncbi:50S ribosomal protein L23 [Candidatus Nitrospira bockiana]
MKREPQDILIQPLLTEKLTAMREKDNKVGFIVRGDANRVEIKRAVEVALKVRVDRVNVMNMLGKTKRLGRFAGKRPDWKKAIVTLKEGEKLEIYEGV